VIQFLTVQLITTFAAGVFLAPFRHRDLPLPAEAILFGFPSAMMLSLVVSVLFPRLNRLRYLPSVICRSFFLIAAVNVGFAIGLWLYGCAQLDKKPFDPDVIRFVQNNAIRPDVRYGALFVVAALLVYAAFEQLTRRLGPGSLEALLMGKYHHPRREDRIFMFLDLKDSTGLAERLGELKFSALLRDFFRDLTPAIIESGATVAEYVGDEAVLTWTLRKGLRRARCVGAYWIAKRTLERKSDWYLQRYGVCPDFKAGMHCGSVVATEVGEVKVELVFHGDVLNTTARLTSLCSELGTDLIVSKELADQLPEVPGLVFHDLGTHALKGKDNAVPVVTPVALPTRKHAETVKAR
jgi:adenylate cyclase